jgi:hypothetical protein
MNKLQNSNEIEAPKSSRKSSRVRRKSKCEGISSSSGNKRLNSKKSSSKKIITEEEYKSNESPEVDNIAKIHVSSFQDQTFEQQK